MRKDSEIADKIMHEFVSCGIPIKCIHDSFIVPAQYESELKELMVAYFQEIMKTDYAIGITTETTLKESSRKIVSKPVLHSVEEQAVEHQTEKDRQDDVLDDNMKYFIGIPDDKNDEDLVIIPEGSRFAGIRI
jgi:hypothetical protein